MVGNDALLTLIEPLDLESLDAIIHIDYPDSETAYFNASIDQPDLLEFDY